MTLHIEEGNFSSFDNSELYFQVWPSKSPKAIVLGVHGLGEHGDCYKFVGEALSSNNIAFGIFDHRGHGRSEGKRGIGSIDDFVLDTKVFIQEMNKRYGGLPFFLLGHSMGGLVLAKYLIRHGLSGAHGAVFSSPLTGVVVDIPNWKKKSAGFLSKTLPGITLFNEIPNKNLTHDREVINYYERDHLRHNRISAPLFVNMLESIEYIFKNSDQIKGNLLFQVAGQDLVVSRTETERFFKKITEIKKKLIVYENFYHEIYNEVSRAQPLGDLVAWLNIILKG